MAELEASRAVFDNLYLFWVCYVGVCWVFYTFTIVLFGWQSYGWHRVQCWVGIN